MFTFRFSTVPRATLFNPRIWSPTIFRTDYSTKKKNRGFRISRDDLDIITNPTMDYWKSFMITIGPHKSNFKLSDHYVWKETFKDDYKVKFFCLKGTKKVIGAYKTTIQRALPSHDNMDSIFFGFIHILEEYRGSDIMRILGEETWKDRENYENVFVSTSSVSYPSWVKTFPASKISFDLNWTYYKGENVKVPNPPMVFDDIIVRSAHDVPDDDITKYDQSIYPFERSKYMLRLLRDPEGFGKVAYDKYGNVIGIGTLTYFPSGDGTISPLYADNDRAAQAIFQESLKDVEEAGIKMKNIEARFSKLEGFDNASWMAPFLTLKPSPSPYAHHLHTHSAPIGLDRKKVYCNVFNSVSSI